MIGKNIQRIRQAKGWTREKLSERYKRFSDDTYPADCIEDVENRQRAIFPKQVRVFAKALGVSVDELIEGDKMYMEIFRKEG